MLKIYYNLQNDLIDRQSGNIGLLDILQGSKCHLYTELSQLKGEKIDIAYINDNDQILSQLGEQQIKKISIITKHVDDIIIPRNFIKYSSDLMASQNGKFYNIILNNKNYKTDNEIIILGEDNIYQDVARNLYSLYGNVIMSTMSKYNISELTTTIKTRNLPNCGNIYYTVFTMLEGLKKCVIKKNIIKVRPDEHFADLNPIISSLQNDDRLVITNLHVRKVSNLKFSIGDHLLAGKFKQIYTMYSNAIEILNNKVTEMRKKIRLEYAPEQILVLGYLQDSLDFIGAKTEKYIKSTMIKNFIMIPIDDLGNFRVPIGKQLLISGKSMNKELYTSVCEVKTLNDI